MEFFCHCAVVQHRPRTQHDVVVMVVLSTAAVASLLSYFLEVGLFGLWLHCRCGIQIFWWVNRHEFWVKMAAELQFELGVVDRTRVVLGTRNFLKIVMPIVIN